MALYGLALRWSTAAADTIDDAKRSLCRKLRTLIATEVGKLARAVLHPVNPQRQRLVLGLVLTTQVLRGYSSLLRDAAQQLRQRISRRNVEAAREALEEVEVLLWSFVQAYTVVWRTDGHRGQRTHGATQERDNIPQTLPDFYRGVVFEVRGSHLVNSWAACFLELLGCGEWGAADSAKLLLRFIGTLRSLKPPPGMFLIGEHISVPLTAIQYLLSLVLVRGVSMLDGGTAYGMGADAPEVRLLNAKGELLRPDRDGTMESSPVLWALEALVDWFPYCRNPSRFGSLLVRGPADGGTVRQLPPYNTAATFDLCIRTAAAAVESWQHHQRFAAQVGRGSGASTFAAGSSSASTSTAPNKTIAAGRLVLPLKDCSTVAAKALHTAYTAVQSAVSARGGDLRHPSAAAASRLTALWTAFVQGLTTVMSTVEAVHSRDHEVGNTPSSTPPSLRGNCWNPEVPQADIEWRDVTDPYVHPAAPSGTTTALISARVIPCAEHLLRTFPGDAVPLVPRPAREMWHELLLFAPLEDMAGLVASLAKRVHWHVRQAAPYAGPGDTASGSTGTATQMGRLQLLGAVSTSLSWLKDMFDVQMLGGYASSARPVEETKRRNVRHAAEGPAASGVGSESVVVPNRGGSCSSSSTETAQDVAAARCGSDPGLSGADAAEQPAADVSAVCSGGDGPHRDGHRGSCNGLAGDACTPFGAGGDDESASASRTAAGASASAEGGSAAGGTGAADDGPGPVGRAADGEAAPAAPGLRGGAQLAVLWSFASARLLPHVSSAYRQLMRLAEGHRLGNHKAAVASAELGATCLCWCEVLVRAYLAARERGQLAAAARKEGQEAKEGPTRHEPSRTVGAAAAAAGAAGAIQAEAAGVSGSAAADAEEWRALLLREVDVVGVLAAVSAGLRTDVEDPEDIGLPFLRLLLLCCAAFPYEMRDALTGAAGSGAAAGVSSRGRKPRGEAPSAGASAERVHLRLDDVLHELVGPDGVLEPYDDDEAKWMEEVVSIVSLMSGPWTAPPDLQDVLPPCDAADGAAALLLPPKTAWTMVQGHCCANPDCINLDDSSERKLLLRRRDGGGGGAGSYCSKECQRAHGAAGQSAAECWAGGGSAEAGAVSGAGIAGSEGRAAAARGLKGKGGTGSSEPGTEGGSLCVVDLLDDVE